MNDLPNELPPNPFDEATVAPPDVAGTAADFLSNVSPPSKAPQPRQAPGEQPSSLGGIYFNDTRVQDDPRHVGKYITKGTFFGGEEDAAEEERHPGMGDKGYYAGGGGSFDPKTRISSTIPTVALPEEWKGIMPYGTKFKLYNPNDPSREVTVVYADQGPARRIQNKGIGLDAYLPNDIKQYLGLKSGDNFGMDLSSVMNGTASRLEQPPQPGTTYDKQIGDQIRQEIGQQPASSMIAGDITADSISQAMKAGPKYKNPDGSLNFGGGISLYKNSGVIQVEAGGQVYQWHPGEDKPRVATVHQGNTPPELIKESREAGLPIIKENNAPMTPVELQTQLDKYYKDANLSSPAIRKEAENIVKMQMSSRNPWSKQYLAIAPNYETIVDIANKPGRTGADDIAMLQAIANIEAPGRSSTGHDMHQWAQARGLAGQLHVTKERYGSLFDFLTGKMSQDDWEKGGHTLPSEMIPQLKRVADRAMESRYRQYMLGITPVINRLKKLGVDPTDYIPDVVNPITGISPFGEGGAEAAAKTKDEVVKEVKPGLTPTLDPQTAATKAQRVLADPNSSQTDRDIAEKVMLSLQNSR